MHASPTNSMEAQEKKKHVGLGSKSSTPSAEYSKQYSKTAKPNRSSLAQESPSRKSNGGAETSDLISRRLVRHTLNPSVTTPKRRNNTGTARVASPGEKKAITSATQPVTRDKHEGRRASLPPSSTNSSVADARRARLSLQPSPISEGRRVDSAGKSFHVKSNHNNSASSKVSTSSAVSQGRVPFRRATSSASSPSTLSTSVTSRMKSKSLSSSLVDKGPILTTRRRASTLHSRDTQLIMLPRIETKAGDDLRIDLRGNRIRSLIDRGLNLSATLEFVYLRDNVLSSLEGIEILKRVKVLDLSFNNFKDTDFKPLGNCKALQQLYLAGNHITSLATLPELPNLEFLSIAQNRLKSLCMAHQPRLQVLAASKNRISTLQGFPYFPVLEQLRVEENPIIQMPHLEAACLLLVGLTLKKFNDRDLSHEEIEISKKYPAHTALCIRDGWELCLPENADELTFHFLAERWKDQLPPSLTLKKASIDQPFEGDACHCSFVFSSDDDLNLEHALILKYQWFIGEKFPNFVAIDDAISEVYWPKHQDIGKTFKVECSPIFQGMEYPSVFALSARVFPGTGKPKILNLTVHGELVEGKVIRGHCNVAWCGGTPGKGVSSWLRRKWNTSPVVILGAEDEYYQLSIDDIDYSLVYMYTPVTEEGVKGEPQYAMTDFVKAALPSVCNVKILGDPIEGNTIKGIGEYFGGKEGPSKFEWSRQNKETGDRLLVCAGTTEYILTKEDIGWRMIFAYIPINFEGQEGVTVAVASEVIRKAPPKVSGLQILGELREGSKVTVDATVTGGTEGSSRVQWFKTRNPLCNGENDLEVISASKIAKAFRIPLGAVGYYLVAKFTPMAPDGDSGELAFAISAKTVETLPPSVNFLAITGEYLEGEMLTASYGYTGGHEGKSSYNWFLHENENETGALIQEASGFLQYCITKSAIGKFISFKCTPIREDGTIGDPKICMSSERVSPGRPHLLSLKILGEGIEGATLFAEGKYWGGVEGSSVFQWFQINDDGTQSEIKGANSVSYVLSGNDIGHMISVSCEPIRSDSVHGPILNSLPFGPVLPGLPTCKSLEFHGSMVQGECLSFTSAYSGGEQGNCTHEWFRVKNNGSREWLSVANCWDLTLSDVGMCIELVYTPVRKDGQRGSPASIISTIILPANPKGIGLTIPNCYEDQEVVPHKSYYGGQEGDGIYTWYRTGRKLDEAELMNISNATDDVLMVGNTLTFTPSLEDVGAYLVLDWVPTRADGKHGDQMIALSNPVQAAFPVVSNVCIKELSSNAYAGEGKYYGGYEGSSMFCWCRKSNEGIVDLISGANSANYEVTDSDYNCQLIFGYTPVRSDSLVGEKRFSEPTKTILPEVPRIEMLSISGRVVEGEVIKAVEIIPENEAQQNVWKKYKKEVKYQWFVSTHEGTQSFESFPSHCSQLYKLHLEDVGRCLKCECIVKDAFGRSSQMALSVTAPVSPGIPKVDKLEIEGRGYHTNLYAVRGIYSGGKEGKSKIQWLRSMDGSPDLVSIPGETGRMYEGNVDDVGYRLVAVYTPIREDGLEGQPASVSTETIGVEPDVYKEVKKQLDLGSVKYEVLYDKDQSQKKAPGLGNLERRILEVNRKRVKVVKPGSKASFPVTEIRGTYAPPFHVELYRSDQHRFKIVVDSENEVDLMVQTRHMRDVIVLVIRGLAQKFNSTSLSSLLKIEA